MKKKSSTVKVGILALISFVLLVFILIWLRGRGLSSGIPYVVRFTDVDGMQEGAAVQMMGIRVGFVDKVAPELIRNKYYVRVTFTINNPDIHILKGSHLSIEQSGLIGDKFIEITPPQLKEVIIPTLPTMDKDIHTGMNVKILYQEGLLTVGRVERLEKAYDKDLVQQKLFYRITLPGAQLPDSPIFDLAPEAHPVPGQPPYYLRITSEEPVLAAMPDKNLKFTVEDPLRMKRFLEIQLESAEALETTNLKINQLLSDQTIASMKNTLKNTEILTARTTEVLDTANTLFHSAHQDLADLVHATDDLSHNLTQVSQNVNDLIGDPNFKRQILSTTASLQESSTALKNLLNDPDLKQTLALTKTASGNAAELTDLLRRTAEDKDLQERLSHSLTLLNDSLSKLSVVLGNVDQLSNKNKNGVLVDILKDTQQASENLKAFSEKLNKRFLLFRLMF